MKIYNEFKTGEDTSDDDEDTKAEAVRKFIMFDSGQEIVVGDKIYIKEGELTGVVGTVTNFG